MNERDSYHIYYQCHKCKNTFDYHGDVKMVQDKTDYYPLCKKCAISERAK